MKSFYPTNVLEALEIMDSHSCKPIGGGTDLMIRGRSWQDSTRNFNVDIVFISHLKELKAIKEDSENYYIGAAVTQQELLNYHSLPQYFKEVLGQMATVSIRNTATIAGNICNAASVADLLPLMYILNAKVELESVGGKRLMAIADFELSKYHTAIHTNELIKQIIVPKVDVNAYYYKKIGQRKASILSKISFIALKLSSEARVAVGAVNDTVIRSEDLERKIFHRDPIETVLSDFKLLLNSADDQRSTKAYKERVAMNLLVDWLGDYYEKE